MTMNVRHLAAGLVLGAIAGAALLQAVWAAPPEGSGAGGDFGEVVEKPVALDVKSATAVRDAIRAAGVLSSVGYSLRYFPATEAARRYFDEHGHWPDEAA